MNKAWIEEHKKEAKYLWELLLLFVSLMSSLLFILPIPTKDRKFKGGKAISYLILKRGDIVQ